MRKTIVMLASALALCAQGAWYWPFGTDRDSTNAPPRLHRLLKPANNYIELAQDASLNGDAEKAIENYRLALGELDRVEAENPDRAAGAEFAPLRLRRAACTAAIDAIRFAQVNENVRPVSVSDTTELQKRWNKAHGIADEEDELPAGSKAERAGKKDPEKEKKTAPPARVEEEKPADAQERVPTASAPVEEKKATALPKGWNGRIAQAMADLRAQDYAAADVLLESMLKERPRDLNALLLRAAAQAGTKSLHAAQRTLERAMRAHPKSYLPYYNLANLQLQMRNDLLQQGGAPAAAQEYLETAQEYYELGRTVGGPVNKALEARLKGVAK